ncbi:MAG: helix-turn-helix transcriptional regulator [Mycoplasma sp.]|nr:helix-turn-helix transcriptional regulator [Mycoplasma sp.]MDY4618473.1 helix-turn-helix transcriptional regulator [Bacilli bacterium]
MNNIKDLRKQRDILQTKLALDLNLTQEAISSYETERVTPSADVLIKLADYFNTNIDYLLCRTTYNLPIKDIKPNNINDEQFQLLLKYNNLSKSDKAKVEGYIDGLNSK